jgi:hypothetical protein
MNEILKNNDKVYTYPLNGDNCYWVVNKYEKSIKNISLPLIFIYELDLISFWFQFNSINFNNKQTLFYTSQEFGNIGRFIIYKDIDNILKINIISTAYNVITNLITIEQDVLYNIIIYQDSFGYRIIINSKNTEHFNKSVTFLGATISNTNITIGNSLAKPLTNFSIISFGATITFTSLFNETSAAFNFSTATGIVSNNSFTLQGQTDNMNGFISNVNFIKFYNTNSITYKTLFNEIFKTIYNNGIPKKLTTLNKYNIGILDYDFNTIIKKNNTTAYLNQDIDLLNVNKIKGTLTSDVYFNKEKYFGVINDKVIEKKPKYFFNSTPANIKISDYIFPEIGTILINNLRTGSTITDYNIKDISGNTSLSKNITNICINNSNIYDSTISGSVYNFIIRNTPTANPLWKLDYTFNPLENNRFPPNFWFSDARLGEFNFNHTNPNSLGKLNIQYLSLTNNNFASTSKTTLKTLFHNKNNITFDNLYINNPSNNSSNIRLDENPYTIDTLNINLTNDFRNSAGTYSFNYNHLTPASSTIFTVNFSANCTNFYWQNNNLTKIEGNGVVDFNFVFTPLTQKRLSLFNLDNSNIRRISLTSTRSDSTLVSGTSATQFNLSNNLFNTGFTEFFNTLSLNNFNGLDQINVSNSGLYGSFNWTGYSISARFGDFNNVNSSLNFGLSSFHRFLSLPSGRTLNFTTTNDYTILDSFNRLDRLERSQISLSDYTGTTVPLIGNNSVSGSCTFLNVEGSLKERITLSTNTNSLSINNPDSNVTSYSGSPKYTYQLEFTGSSLLNISTLDLSPKVGTYNVCYFNGPLIFNNSLYSTSYNINTSNVGYNQYLLTGSTYQISTVGLCLPQINTGNSINFVGATSINLLNLTGNTSLILNSANSNLTGITFQTAGTCTVTSFNISNTPILNLSIPSTVRITTGTFNALNMPYLNSNTGYTYPLGDIIQSLTINIGSTNQGNSYLLNNSVPIIQNNFSANTYYLATQMEPIQILSHLEKIYNTDIAYTGTGWQFGVGSTNTSAKVLNIRSYKINSTDKTRTVVPTGYVTGGTNGNFTTANSPANIITRLLEIKYVLTNQVSQATGGVPKYRWTINL